MSSLESPSRLFRNRLNAIGAFAVCVILSLIALWLVAIDVKYHLPLPERDEMTVIEGNVRSFECQEESIRTYGRLTLYLREMPKFGISASKFGISCALWKNHPPERVRYLAHENRVPNSSALYYPWELEINGKIYTTFEDARRHEFTGVMVRAGFLFATATFTIWAMLFSGIGLLRARRCHVTLLRWHPDLRTVRLTRLINEHADCNLGRAHDFVRHFVSGRTVAIPFRSVEQAEKFAAKLSDEHVEFQVDRRMIWRPLDWWNRPSPLFPEQIASR